MMRRQIATANHPPSGAGGGRARKIEQECSAEAPVQVHRLVLVGELAHDSAVALEAEIDELCRSRIDVLVLDLTRLREIDETGITVIALRSRLCASRGVQVELIRGPRRVQRGFELAGLAGELPFRGDSEADRRARENLVRSL
jgi:anti-anti-sigma factor